MCCPFCDVGAGEAVTQTIIQGGLLSDDNLRYDKKEAMNVIRTARFYLARRGSLVNRKRLEVGYITKKVRYCKDTSEPQKFCDGAVATNLW